MPESDEIEPDDGREALVEPLSRRSVTVGILTYRRPDDLTRCLDGVLAALGAATSQTLGGGDGWSIDEVMIVDNDPAESARSVVDGRPSTPIPIRYAPEPTPGVAAARNRALDAADGDVLIFIDDDEIPGDGWPFGLLETMAATGAAMVGGPVLSEFTTTPPSWITDGEFFARNDPENQAPQEWLRSGNLAIDLAQIRPQGLRFDPRFRQGEDSAFTRNARASGLDLRWSSSGSIVEYINPERFAVRWRLEREYRSHRAWTRSSLDLASTGPARLGIRGTVLAVAGARAVEAAVRVAAGLATANKARWVTGLMGLAGSAGKVAEIVGYRPARSS